MLDFVLDGQVALATFDLVLRDVCTVHQLGVRILVQPIRFEVTGVAVLTGNEAVTDHCLIVAACACEILFQYRGVVEPEVSQMFGIHGLPVVTRLAIRQPFGECMVDVAFLFHVAQETARLGDEQVLTLDNL
jgi:hypothetical protein